MHTTYVYMYTMYVCILCMYVYYVCMYTMYVCILCMYVYYVCMYTMYVCILCMYAYYCMYVYTNWWVVNFKPNEVVNLYIHMYT